MTEGAINAACDGPEAIKSMDSEKNSLETQITLN